MSNESHIDVTSTCPYCNHNHVRSVRAVVGSKLGDHFCDQCKQQYEEHYTVSVNVNTYPIASQYRKLKA